MISDGLCCAASLNCRVFYRGVFAHVSCALCVVLLLDETGLKLRARRRLSWSGRAGGEYFDFFFDSEYFDLMFSARWLCLGCQGPSALSGLATWQVINQPAGIESNRHVHLEGIYQPMEKGPETFL